MWLARDSVLNPILRASFPGISLDADALVLMLLLKSQPKTRVRM